ncbi:MAG: sulfite exporter TauE/SafE family protein [Betaproteobacteria bacterium]|nr:MAG: sulfite exporter TauE/SafE family protein [Betaproteobacteria bacterium]
MAELSYWQLAWIAAVFFFAFVVRGMSGFGAGMIAVPLLAFAIPLQLAVPLCSLLVFVLFVILVIRDRREVVWSELRLLVPPTIIGALAGLWLFAMLDNRMLVMMLGSFLVLYASYMLAVSVLGLPQLRCSQRWALPVGFFGSFFDTLFGGGGGTLVVIYINARGIGRAGFRATVAALWFTEMITRIGGYAWAGFYDARTLVLFALLLPLMWAGTVVGERLGNRVSSDTFTRILAVMLLASGASLLAK